MIRIIEYIKEQDKLIKKFGKECFDAKGKEELAGVLKKLFEEATLLGVASAETEIELMTKKHLSERASRSFRITLSDKKKTESITDKASAFWDKYSLKLAGDFEEDKLREVEKMFKEKFKEGSWTRAELMKGIQEKLDIKNKVRLNMIVTTETTKCFNYGRLEVAKENYRNGGIVRGLRFNAVMDIRTSPTCQSRNGLVLAIDDPRIDENTPPLHINCRSLWTTVDKWDWDEKYNGESSPEWITKKSVQDTKPDGSWGNAFAYGGEKEKLEIIEKSSIIERDKINKFKEFHDNWDRKDIKKLASNIVEYEGLPIKVQKHAIENNGQCKLSISNAKIEVKTFELNSKDLRNVEYKTKTMFHELFHAKVNDLEHDIKEVGFTRWAYIDDVFAESTAHYLVKEVGLTKEITPAYARHLIETLPKLKKIEAFKDCKTIADFGEVAYSYRFGNNLTAKWKPLIDELDKTKFDLYRYSGNYLDYIEKNKVNLIEQTLENMPSYIQYKDEMIENVEDSILKIKNNQSLNKNEKMMFENVLIITMNRLGVRLI